MNVAIHSIGGTLYAGTAEKLICDTPQGQMTVLDHHLPLIARISGPSMSVVQKTAERSDIALSSGFLEVRPNSEIVILAQ